MPMGGICPDIRQTSLGLCRQQEYLEKTVEGLKRKLQATSEGHRANSARYRQARAHHP